MVGLLRYLVGPGTRRGCFDLRQELFSPTSWAFHTSAAICALRDSLPFIIHEDNKLLPDIQLEQINAAFNELSKDPVFQFAVLDNRPLGEVPFEGAKTDEGRAILEYALLVESGREDTLPPVKRIDGDGDGWEALYKFASISDVDVEGEGSHM